MTAQWEPPASASIYISCNADLVDALRTLRKDGESAVATIRRVIIEHARVSAGISEAVEKLGKNHDHS